MAACYFAKTRIPREFAKKRADFKDAKLLHRSVRQIDCNG